MKNPIPPPGSVALVIGRFSSDMQNPLSADDQVQACVERCEQHGWIVRRTFKDEAKSGRSVVKRTGYLEMMATAEADVVDVIVAVSLDRIGRNSRELHDARNRLADVDAVIYTLDRGVTSKLEFALLAELAEMESDKIGQRSMRGRRAAAARGKFIGDVPYGYRAVLGPEGKQIEKDPVTSPIVLRVNQDYAAGMSPVKIAVALTREGIPTPKGARAWLPTTLLGTRNAMNGLLRNPINKGQVWFGKSTGTYNRKTGNYIKKKASADDIQVFEAPWLRIVSDELWQQVQDRAAGRSFTPLRETRNPEYLLTGLVKCAKCGGSYTMTSSKLGCANRRIQACDNNRRVVREDLERVVLDGLRGRIAQAHIIEWFLPEYLQELEQAAKEGEGKNAIRRTRLEDVNREIENLLKQMREGATGYAARFLNENLESLGREQEQLSRDLRAQSPTPELPAGPGAVVERLHALLDDLGASLKGDERDAARARDIVRSFIQKVIIMPVDAEGRPDRRGCGPVRVTVEGAITTLVDQALLNRKIMHRPSSTPVQALPTARFRYYVDLDRALSATQEGIYADQATLSRLLEEADFPIRRHELAAALRDADPARTDEDEALLERRVDCALRYLQSNDWVRAVRRGRDVGWVSTARNIPDVEWRERLRDSDAFTPPIGVVRITPPEAFVVVVETR